MSNKTQLQTNNTALDGYIARINAAKDAAASLPEAGGSGTEVFNITIQGAIYDMYYLDESDEFKKITSSGTYAAKYGLLLHATELFPMVQGQAGAEYSYLHTGTLCMLKLNRDGIVAFIP